MQIVNWQIVNVRQRLGDKLAKFEKEVWTGAELHENCYVPCEVAGAESSGHIREKIFAKIFERVVRPL